MTNNYDLPFHANATSSEYLVVFIVFYGNKLNIFYTSCHFGLWRNETDIFFTIF